MSAESERCLARLRALDSAFTGLYERIKQVDQSDRAVTAGMRKHGILAALMDVGNAIADFGQALEPIVTAYERGHP